MVDAVPDTEQPPPMATPRVAAGALFFDKDDNVLLVKPAYKNGWDIPGGYVEPSETPSEACHREVREELGITVQVRRLLAVDWAPSTSEGDKLLFVFDGGPVVPDTREFKLSDNELTAYAFKSARELDDLMPARLARRLHAAAAARKTGTVAYLEHGVATWSNGQS